MYRAHHQACDFTKLSDDEKKQKMKAIKVSGQCYMPIWCSVLGVPRYKVAGVFMSGGEMILRLHFSGVLQSSI